MLTNTYVEVKIIFSLLIILGFFIISRSDREEKFQFEKK